MANSTDNWNLPYEDLTDPPGHSLHGGLTGTDPILAIEVDRHLTTINSNLNTGVGDLQTQLDLLQTQFITTGAQVIDYINTGTGTNDTEFVNIPQTFKNLCILWNGVSDGAGQIDSLALRFNGDGGNNYISRLARNTEADAYSTSSGTFSVLRTGYVGTLRSAGVTWISDYSISGVTKYAHGTGIAFGAGGGNNTFTNQGGGRWTGNAAIHAVRIWVSSQLWAGNPRITLMGIP